MSAFTFDEHFAEYIRRHGTPKGYAGSCFSRWLWFDIDAAGDLERARIDAGKLGQFLCERYAVDDVDLLLFFSGAKGFHIGLPTVFFAGAIPGPTFHRIARRLAEKLAERAGVTIDAGVYDAVRAFRAPNSRHPKTGLHKRRLSLEAIQRLGVSAILELSRLPEPFEVPAPTINKCDFNPSADWNEAAASLEAEVSKRIASSTPSDCPSLNQVTRQFINDGAETGDRHRLLYSAARNLAEFSSVSALAFALLMEPARNAGLSPSDARRQIECGLKDGGQAA